MNIQQAKEEIARIYRAYQKKNPDGSLRIPLEKQRPVLLIGPPGIGKTAIMKQISDETGCGLLSYSMTHHTRQSAIGLPFISEKEYGGKTYSVTEYTMSEIVASIYDYMRETGKTSGILFLDEINCVSETLTPVMLQLLQNKTFGNVPLPEGWIIVAAGNPPEYNKSVRELDMVTLDRVKNMEISADVGVWQEYARKNGVHPAIRTYLSLYPDHFYNITNTDRGQLFVTARGWEDLSCILQSYEEDGENVDSSFFLQYLQHDDIARSFSVYYDLFRHFLAGGPKENVPSGDIIASPENLPVDGGGTSPENTPAGTAFENLLKMSPERLAALSQTECLAVAAILFHSIQLGAHERSIALSRLNRLSELTGMIPSDCDFASDQQRNAFFAQKKNALAVRAGHGLVKPEEEFFERFVLTGMENDAVAWAKERRNRNSAAGGDEGFQPEALSPASDFREYEKALIAERKEAEEKQALLLLKRVEDAYHILEQCQESAGSLMYLTTDLSGDPDTAALLTGRDLPVYLRYCSELLADV
ncbi:MAG: AAA family ATPase [Lachnospiraceae bacterium]|nr:AAA family ATPase [Lachnospiraceae bacterium]